MNFQSVTLCFVYSYQQSLCLVKSISGSTRICNSFLFIYSPSYIFNYFCYFYFHMLAFTSSHSLGNILQSSKLYATYTVFLVVAVFSSLKLWFILSTSQGKICGKKKHSACHFYKSTKAFSCDKKKADRMWRKSEIKNDNISGKTSSS